MAEPADNTPAAAEALCLPSPPAGSPAAPDRPLGLPAAPESAVAEVPAELPGPAGAVASAAGPGPAAAQPATDAVPDYRSNPLPDYPYLARQKRWQGVVWLLVDVTAEGLVADLRIERSCGHGVLDRAARRTVQRWRFSPAKRGGVPTASQVRIPVRFQLEDS